MNEPSDHFRSILGRPRSPQEPADELANQSLGGMSTETAASTGPTFHVPRGLLPGPLLDAIMAREPFRSNVQYTGPIPPPPFGPVEDTPIDPSVYIPPRRPPVP